MPEISIIVPVYNVEKYLDKCIQSILQQSFPDFELILVDDGSTDSSGKLCDFYKEQDSRIHVIHKTNGGLSAARNSGLEIATGNYIGFVDSDDYIAPDMYEFLLEKLQTENADISSCRYNICYKNRIISPKGFFYIVFDNGESALRAALKRIYLNVPVWNRLYKKEIFSSIRFPEGSNYEDFYILGELFQNDLKIVSCSECKYYYTRRNNSITKTYSAKNITDRVTAYQKVNDFIHYNYPSLNDLIFAELSSAHLQGYATLLRLPKQEQKHLEQKLLSYIYKNKTAILHCPELTYRQKLHFQLFYFSKSLFIFLVIIRQYFHKIFNFINQKNLH